MKRLWICLLALLLLAGCGGQETGSGEPQVEQEQSAGAFSLGLDTEWDVYDPSVETIWCVLSYEGAGEPLEFGTEYRLEVQRDGAWEQVPLAEDAAWYMVQYTLNPNRQWAFACSLSMFDYDFADGDYRVVKEIGGLPCKAEFTLETGAAVSAETPYGFGPMEDVPEYGDPCGAGRIRRGGVHGGRHGECGRGGDLPGKGLPGHSLPAADPSKLL